MSIESILVREDEFYESKVGLFHTILSNTHMVNCEAGGLFVSYDIVDDGGEVCYRVTVKANIDDFETIDIARLEVMNPDSAFNGKILEYHFCGEEDDIVHKAALEKFKDV